MKKSIFFALFLFVFMQHGVVVAETNVCKFDDNGNYETTFTDIKNKGMLTSEMLCGILKDKTYIGGDVSGVMQNFVVYYEFQILNTFKESDFPGITLFLGRTRDYILNSSEKVTLSTFRFERLEKGDLPGAEDGSVIFYYSDRNKNRLMIHPEKNAICKSITNGKSCVRTFEDLSNALNTYHQGYTKIVTTLNLTNLNSMSKKWDTFVEDARSQTILDVMITSFIHRDYYKQEKLVAPASTQYFFLHPSVVYEHLEDVPSGDRDEFALALELVGINWWDLPVPLGVSAGWVYSDRANASAIAGSVMFHIYNQYTVGYTMRDDEDGGDGVFLSVDLLKFFEDKKQVLDDYRTML